MILAMLAVAAAVSSAPLSSDDLFSPELRGREVVAEGVVHDARMLDGGALALSVYRTVAAFTVIVDSAQGADAAAFEDALVSVRGTLGVRLGADGVSEGVEIRAKDLSAVSMLVPPPGDPFAMEPVSVLAARSLPGDRRRHRIHVRGVVIFSRDIDTSFMMHLEEGRNIRVVPADLDAPLPKTGDLVDVCAFIAEVSVTPQLDDALVRIHGHDDSAVPPPENLDVGEIVRLPYASGADAESLYARTVATQGRIREVNRREKFMQIFLTDGNETLLVLVPFDQSLPTPDGFLPGATVRAQGNISFYHHSGLLLSDRPDPHQNLTLHTESADDVALVNRAPYWTVGKLWALVGFVALFLTTAGALIAWLVRRFERARADAARRERLRLSHDLHDNLQQLLAATMFRLDAAKSYFDVDPAASKEQLGWAKKSVANTQAGLRSVLWDLQEESEGPESLAGLVKYAVGRMPHWRGRVEVKVAGAEPAAARSFGGRFLMILQEAVGNALVHGQAAHVEVRLYFRTGLVRLMIVDDGCGFVPEDAPGAKDGHLGLSSIALRARELGGTLSVKSEPGKGTAVIVEVSI